MLRTWDGTPGYLLATWLRTGLRLQGSDREHLQPSRQQCLLSGNDSKHRTVLMAFKPDVCIVDAGCHLKGSSWRV